MNLREVQRHDVEHRLLTAAVAVVFVIVALALGIGLLQYVESISAQIR
jgi:hypothetical protein